MRQRVQQNVDAGLIALDRERVEVLRVGGLLLEGVAEIGIVRDEDHHVTLLVIDGASFGRRTVLAALGRASTHPSPRTDGRNLDHPLHIELLMEERMVEWHINDWKFGCWQRLTDLARPHLPRPRAPEIIGPEEAAFQQV